MLNYRISKYNPSNSYENYHFYNYECSSFQDVGEKMDSVVLTLDEYKKVETAYIDTIIDLMDSINWWRGTSPPGRSHSGRTRKFRATK